MKQNPKTGKGAKIKRDNPLQITKKEVLINMIREVELAFLLGKEYTQTDLNILEQELTKLIRKVETVR
jgi:hypothetical protein